MHLKRLELFGFKTFPDRTILEFNEPTGIAAIVGPNGCGKSNIIDAFRWVMGEQSIKLLRGTSQEEIIFAGTDDRKAVSMAEVTLTIDNSDHKLPIDYSEVQISRRYYRSGDSEYLINKEPVRLKDVQELLMDTGIGKGSYAIIGQGQVVAILHSKPEDRRVLFEEAAGINKYKTRKNVTERKLQNAEQNLTRLKDIRSEIHQQLGPLEEQARVAKEYQVLKKDLAQLEIGLFKVKVGKITEFKTELEKTIGEYKKLVDEADLKAEQIAQKRQEFKDKILEIDQKIAALSVGLKTKQSEREKAQNTLHVTQERVNNHSQRMEKLLAEIEQLTQGKQSVEQRITETLLELEAGRKAVVEFSEKLSRKNDETKGIFERWQILSQEIGQFRTKLNEHNEKIENKKSKLMGLESSERVIANDLQRIETTLATVVKEQEELAAKEKELLARKEYIDTTIADLRNKRDELFKQRSSKEKERKTLVAHRSDIKEKFDSQSSRLRLLEEMQQSHEGFQKGVRSVFQARQQNVSGFQNVRKVIADILTVSKEYEAAVEAALENNLQAIIANDQQSISSVIGYLRERSLGRASFIPADLQTAEAITPTKGVCAATVVTCDASYKPLINRLLGSVVIVDKLEDALQLYPQAKAQGIRLIVTTAGESITIDGIITGGSTGKDAVSLLGRQREIIELRKNIEDFKAELAICDQKQKEIEQRFLEIENDLKNYGNELKTLEIEQGTVANDLARMRMDKDKFGRQHETAVRDQQENKQELQKISTEKNNVTAEMNVLLQGKEEQESVIVQKEQELESARSEKDSVNELLTEIKISSTNAEGMQRQIELKLESFRESLKNSDLQMQQRNAEQQYLLKEKAQSEALLTEMTSSMPAMEVEIQTIETDITTATTERGRYFNDLDVYDRLDKERSMTDREARSKLAEEEIKRARIDAEYTEMNRRLTNDYGLTIEDVLLSDAVVEDYDKTSEEVEKLRRRIKRMEPVNLLAIEEYEAQKERLAFIETQCEDMEKAKIDMQSIIKELDQQAIQAFKDTFNTVNEHFQRIFVELFRGGSAELKIMDETNVLDSGIEIYAKVPGTKRAQSMTLLSGGQKALTAIALLFSLLTAKPGPFCILDEIDAELDDINIGRVTDILRAYANETQIIVITHRQPTMAIVNTMFGLTMEQKGISKVVSVKLGKDQQETVEVAS
jgi:chromosome segregation protein